MGRLGEPVNPHGTLNPQIPATFAATTPPEALQAICDTIPLGRMAQADELAKLAAFLVSEENTYLTGQVIVADGGFTCR